MRWRPVSLLVIFLAVMAAGLAMPVQARQPPAGVTRAGEIRLRVSDTEQAARQVEQVVTQLGGEILSSETWYEYRYDKSRLYATLIASLPNPQLESAMLSLDGLAMEVLERKITSQDQGPAYVELLSRRSYLELQRDRLESLLALATDETERLRLQSEQDAVLSRLGDVDQQVNDLWWGQHDARLTIQLVPFIPTPTPTIRPTRFPTFTPQPWDPNRTYDQARETLASLMDFSGLTIYLCCGGLVVLAAVAIILLISRRHRAA